MDFNLYNNANRNEVEEFIINLFKCVSHLSENYFYLVNDFLCINQIDYLLGFYLELSPQLRRVLTNVYSRFFVQSPFHIILPDKMQEKEYNDMEKIQNMNLIGKVSLRLLLESGNEDEKQRIVDDEKGKDQEKDIQNKHLETKKMDKFDTIPEDRNENMTTVPVNIDSQHTLSTKNLQNKEVKESADNKMEKKDEGLSLLNKPHLPSMFGIEDNTNEPKLSGISSFNEPNRSSTAGNVNLYHHTSIANAQAAQAEANKREEELKYDTNNFKVINKEKGIGLGKIYKSLEKYKTIFFHCFDEESKNNIEFVFKYFEDTVLYPTVFSLYKIVYFSPLITAKAKYIIYKLVYLYLQCQKFLVEYLKEKLGENQIFQNLLSGNMTNNKRHERVNQVNQLKLLKCLEKHLHLKDFASVDNEEEEEEEDQDGKDSLNDAKSDSSGDSKDVKKDKEKLSKASKKRASFINEHEMSQAQRLMFYYGKIERMLSDISKIERMLSDISYDVNKLGSKSFEHLNVIKVLESWYKYALHFKKVTPYINLDYFINKKCMENKDFNAKEEEVSPDEFYNFNKLNFLATDESHYEVFYSLSWVKSFSAGLEEQGKI